MAKVNVKKGSIEPNLGLRLDIRAINRSTQDIATWRNAIKAAESVSSPRRKRLYTLYAELLLDGHLTAVCEKRREAIINTQIQYIDENGEVDQEATALFGTPWFTDLIEHMVDAVFWGHSLIELLPNKDGIEKANLINRFHVRPEHQIVVVNDSDTNGTNYTEPPYCYYVIEVGGSNDLGLLLQAAQYVIYKRGGFGNWADFSQIFGMPFREGRYDGHDEVTRQQLTTALEEAGAASFAVIPKGSEIIFHTNNAGASGSKDLYQGLVEACNAELSKLILGQTLTTEQGDRGARALGDVHKDVEEAKNKADRQRIENLLNWRLKPILIDTFGYKLNPKGTFRFDDAAPLDVQLERDVKISQMAFIDPDYLERKYGVPILGLKGYNEPVKQEPGKPKPEV